MYIQYYALRCLRWYSHKSMMLCTWILYWTLKLYPLLKKKYTLYTLPNIKHYVRRYYTIISINGTLLMLCKCYGLWAHKPLKVLWSIETTSRYYPFRLLTLLDLPWLVVSFNTGSGFLWTETLRMAFITTRCWGSYGLVIILDDRMWLWHITLHTQKSFIITPCCLVVNTAGGVWWWLGGFAAALGTSVGRAVGSRQEAWLLS